MRQMHSAVSLIPCENWSLVVRCNLRTAGTKFVQSGTNGGFSLLGRESGDSNCYIVHIRWPGGNPERGRVGQLERATGSS